MINIKTGDLEPIFAYILNSSGNPLTGLGDLFVRILRESDSYWLDWNDNSFKNSGWTTQDQPMSETDATYAPGMYKADLDLDTTGFSSGDYLAVVVQDPGTSAEIPTPQSFKVGGFVDTVETNRKWLTNRKRISEGVTTQVITYDDDSTTPIGTQTIADGSGDPIALPTGTPAEITKAT